MKWLLLAFLTSLCAACVLYQSEGRKFLEEQGIEFANSGASLEAQMQSHSCLLFQDLPYELTLDQQWSTPRSQQNLLVQERQTEQFWHTAAYAEVNPGQHLVCFFKYPDETTKVANTETDVLWAAQQVSLHRP